MSVNDKFNDICTNATERMDVKWKRITNQKICRNLKKLKKMHRNCLRSFLTITHAVQCPYCIDAYTQTCLEKGSNIAEMTEAIHVAVAIRGGASLVHGVQIRNVAEKLSM